MTTHKKIVHKRGRYTAKRVRSKSRTHRRVRGGVIGTVRRRPANVNENIENRRSGNNRRVMARTNENIIESPPKCIPKMENHIKIGRLDMSANMIQKSMYKYPVDTSLCVLPTPLKRLETNGMSLANQEAQYEAFQSIFAHIMAANPHKKKNDPPETPYEILCDNHCIKLIVSTKSPTAGVSSKKKKMMEQERIIFFASSESTHYKALIDGKVRDPYDYYQVNLSQGFCQMFAFLLAINNEINLKEEDIPGFKRVNQKSIVNLTKGKPDFTNFIKLVQNSQECFRKSLDYISEENVYDAFENEFDSLFTEIHDEDTGLTKSEHYGIKAGTSLKTYLSDFQKINNVFSAVAYYIYDQQMNITPDERDELWEKLQTLTSSNSASALY